MSRRLIRLAIAAEALTLAAGCAPSTNFQGISFTSDRVAPELRLLAQRAAGGDKQAQLELGTRFENGDGVPLDWGRAERLYRMAAASSGGTIMVYVPPVGRGRSGSVMPMSTGPVVPGLPEARLRLEALEKRRSLEGTPRRI